MKLLFCPTCHHVFNLTFKPRTCDCGRVSGYYKNNTYAVVNGEGVSLAIGNGSFESAIRKMQGSDPNGQRDIFRDECRVEYCWVRPHEGPGNPHTRIEKDAHA